MLQKLLLKMNLIQNESTFSQVLGPVYKDTLKSHAYNLSLMLPVTESFVSIHVRVLLSCRENAPEFACVPWAKLSSTFLETLGMALPQHLQQSSVISSTAVGHVIPQMINRCPGKGKVLKKKKAN